MQKTDTSDHKRDACDTLDALAYAGCKTSRTFYEKAVYLPECSCGVIWTKLLTAIRKASLLERFGVLRPCVDIDNKMIGWYVVLRDDKKTEPETPQKTSPVSRSESLAVAKKTMRDLAAAGCALTEDTGGDPARIDLLFKAKADLDKLFRAIRQISLLEHTGVVEVEFETGGVYGAQTLCGWSLATRLSSKETVASNDENAVIEPSTPNETPKLVAVRSDDCACDRRKNFEEKQVLQAEVARLQAWVDDLQSGMFVNCVYCGHRYGPNSETGSTAREILHRHVAECPRHPLANAKKVLAEAVIGLRSVVESVKKIERLLTESSVVTRGTENVVETEDDREIFDLGGES